MKLKTIYFLINSYMTPFPVQPQGIFVATPEISMVYTSQFEEKTLLSSMTLFTQFELRV